MREQCFGVFFKVVDVEGFQEWEVVGWEDVVEEEELFEYDVFEFCGFCVFFCCVVGEVVFVEDYLGDEVDCEGLEIFFYYDWNIRVFDYVVENGIYYEIYFVCL